MIFWKINKNGFQKIKEKKFEKSIQAVSYLFGVEKVIVGLENGQILILKNNENLDIIFNKKLFGKSINKIRPKMINNQKLIAICSNDNTTRIFELN